MTIEDNFFEDYCNDAYNLGEDEAYNDFNAGLTFHNKNKNKMNYKTETYEATDGKTYEFLIINENCIVVQTSGEYAEDFGWGNGYIKVPEDHPFHDRADYELILADQEINYKGYLLVDKDKGFFLGFDTGHSYNRGYTKEDVIETTLQMWEDFQKLTEENIQDAIDAYTDYYESMEDNNYYANTEEEYEEEVYEVLEDIVYNLNYYELRLEDIRVMVVETSQGKFELPENHTTMELLDFLPKLNFRDNEAKVNGTIWFNDGTYLNREYAENCVDEIVYSWVKYIYPQIPEHLLNIN